MLFKKAFYPDISTLSVRYSNDDAKEEVIYCAIIEHIL